MIMNSVMGSEHSPGVHDRHIDNQDDTIAGNSPHLELKLAVRGDSRIDHIQSQEPEQPGLQSPRKRRRTSRVDDPHADLDGPLKRRKEAFNSSYLAFFNDHVAEVAAKTPHQLYSKLKGSQIGLSEWSPTEKETLFAAVTRLGRDDLPGLASLVQSKSELEIRQYLMLVHDASTDRREGQVGRHGVLKLKSHPSAVEVDQEVCNALEAVADDLALRQEAHEDFLEQQRWGEDDWLVDNALAISFEDRLRSDNPNVPRFGELFNTRKWLQLAENVFMNSVIEDCNWHSAGSGRPAIRATAMDDFYSLVLSVTRRLIATTLTVANSRIRRRKEFTSGTVRPRDVKAAISSLGMKDNTSKFWATAARRLRLNVQNIEDEILIADVSIRASATISEPLSDVNPTEGADSDDDPNDGCSEGEIDNFNANKKTQDGYEAMQESNQGTSAISDEPIYMTYDEVEAELGFPKLAASNESPDELERLVGWEEDESQGEDDAEDDESEEDNEDEDGEGRRESFGEHIRDAHDHDSGSEYDDLDARTPPRASARRGKEVADIPARSEDLMIDMHEIEEDLYEAIHHSAVDFAGTTRARETLMIRIRNEHRQQAEADKLDVTAAKMEEARLWAVIREEEVPEEEPDMGIDAGMSSAPPTTDDEAYDTATDTKTNSGVITKESEEWFETDWRAKLDHCNHWELKKSREF